MSKGYDKHGGCKGHDDDDRDGKVEGTAAGEVIDTGYDGDPDGDMIDAGDAINHGTPGSDDDYVVAGGGDDTVLAGEGDDTVYGEDGDDVISGGAGDNYLSGGAGDDLFIGGEGADNFQGNNGQDNIDYSNSDEGVHVDLASFELSGGDAENDMIEGGIDGVIGSAHDDTLMGFDHSGDSTEDTFTNEFFGMAGDDYIDGRGGDDLIDGGADNDTLIGGEGADTVLGGADADLIIGGDDGDVVDGGSEGDDNDTLDLTGVGNFRLVDLEEDSNGNGWNGTVILYDDELNETGQFRFSEIETILGTPLNDDPEAGDDCATTDEDTPVVIDVLGNDTDPDGDTLSVGEGSAENGTVEVNADGTITYTPAENFNGTDTITYTVEDGMGGSDTATVTVTVNPVNDDPVAGDDSASTDFETPVVIDVLANDSDVDGDTLRVGEVTAENGTVTLNADGTITYTPADGFSGEDTITYTVEDGMGGSDVGIVAVTVAEAPLDGIVEGTEGDDLIDLAYTGDPEGDMIDAGDAILGNVGSNDDIVQAGAGNDTILAEEGNDTIYAGTGDDLVHAGAGDDLVVADGGSDTLYGGAGNDTLLGGNKDDEIYGGTGDDSIVAGAGNDYVFSDGGSDTVLGGEGDDTLIGGVEDDVIDGGEGDDVIDSGFGHDSVTGGAGDDLITAGAGNDTVDGGDGNDTIIAGLDGISDYAGDQPAFPDGDPNTNDGRDSVLGGAGNDIIYTGDDSDTIDGGADDDHINAGIDDDLVDGGEGDDYIIGSHGSDTITGGAGDDTIYGGFGTEPIPGFEGEIDDATDPVPENGRDLIDGGDGNDLIFGEDDDDTLLGGAGDDTIDGGIDNDSIDGGDGNDLLLGGEGDDTIHGGSGYDHIVTGEGNDLVVGGADADTITGVNAGDTVLGGSTGDDFDVLDLTGSLTGLADGSGTSLVDGPTSYSLENVVTDSDGNGIDGTVVYYDASGNETGRLEFENIELIVPCFTPGTRIATPRGERLVEELREGDKVITRDNGIQEIRWVGRKDLGFADLEKAPHMRPILIKAGALGHGMPERDMLVSPNHRMLVASEKTALLFDEREVLVAAKHLVDNRGVLAVPTLGTSYIHFMFDHHEVVLSDGAWTESFQPGDHSLGGIGNAQRSEIFELFPELEKAEGLDKYPSARRTLKRYEARLMVD